jgi:hypothetical protein
MWERLKKVYSSENIAQLRTQRRIDTFFDIRVPPDRDDSDDSYSSSDMSDSSDSTSFASDLSGDTILSFGVLLSSDMSSVATCTMENQHLPKRAELVGTMTDDK